MKFPRLPRKLNRSCKLNEKQIKQIKILVKQGITKTEIAKCFKVTHYTIWYWLLSPQQRKKFVHQRYLKSIKRENQPENKIKKRKRQLKSLKRKFKLVPKMKIYMKLYSRKWRKKKKK